MESKRGKAVSSAAVRQQMLYNIKYLMKSVGVPGFTYRELNFVSFPSSVGMGPTRLLSKRSLPIRRPKTRERRQRCVSRYSQQ